eukprot:1086479_1
MIRLSLWLLLVFGVSLRAQRACNYVTNEGGFTVAIDVCTFAVQPSGPIASKYTCSNDRVMLSTWTNTIICNENEPTTFTEANTTDFNCNSPTTCPLIWIRCN